MTQQESLNHSIGEPGDGFLPTVLIVEDDEDNRELLKVLFETWMFSAIEARDGSEAVVLAREKFPDLILMDVRLPRLDGFEAARQIRDSAAVGNVPIIFLSGCAETKYIDVAGEAGGSGYLVKPIDFEKLRVLVEKHIDISHPF